MTSTTVCPNCNTTLHGQFCSQCGQNQKGTDRFFLTLVNEAFEDLFRWNSRAWRTLFGLMLKPGFLSKEYFKGRRARYVQPIRLYFITSILFFVVLSVVNFFADPVKIELRDEPTEQALNELGVSTTEPSTEVASTEVTASERGSEDQALVAAVEGPVAKAAVEEGTAVKGTTEGAAAEEGSVEEGAVEDEEVIDFGFEDSDISVPFLSNDAEQWLRKNFRTKIEAAAKQATNNPGMVRDALLELTPPILFCLLPLFALLLKLAYVTRGFYYTEHLVLAVHNHSFVFITLTFYTLIEALLRNHEALADGVTTAVSILIPIYLWQSLRNVYQQGKFFTTVKFVVLGSLYVSALGFGILSALIIGALTL